MLIRSSAKYELHMCLCWRLPRAGDGVVVRRWEGIYGEDFEGEGGEPRSRGDGSGREEGVSPDSLGRVLRLDSLIYFVLCLNHLEYFIRYIWNLAYREPLLSA